MADRLTKAIIVGLLAISLVGCGERQGEQPMVSASAETNAPIVFAIVDGKSLTVDRVKEAVLVSARYREICRGKPMPPFGKWSNNEAMRITPGIVQSMVLENELNRLSVRSTEASDSEVLAKYNRRLPKKRNAKSVDDLVMRFGDLGPAFRRQFVQESRIAAFYATHPELEVTGADISRYYHSLSNRMIQCEKINRRARARVNEAWGKLKKGESWENVATNYTEDALLDVSLADNWKDWMSVPAGKLDSDELAQAVGRLDVGGFTAPIETEEGVIIVRLLEKNEDLCSLARILVRMAIDVEFPEREEAIAYVKQEKRVKFQQELLPRLRERMKIEYPLGKKFTYKIWPEDEKKRPLK